EVEAFGHRMSLGTGLPLGAAGRYAGNGKCLGPDGPARRQVSTIGPKVNLCLQGRASCRERAPSSSFYIKEKEKNRSEEHTSELQSRENLVCRLLLEK